MAQVSDTRTKMILAALELFQKLGVNATSVDQILAKSSTGKSQFSHYFKNKEGLIHATLEFLHEAIKSGQTPTGYELNSWKDLERWFKSYVDFQRSTHFELSCPIGTIGTDITNKQILLRKDVQLFMDWSRGQMIRFFAERKAAGELSSTAKPESLTDLCITIMQGGMLLTKINRDPTMFENANKEALNYIKSLRIHRQD